MKEKKVIHLSTVHFRYDPRIVYRMAFSTATVHQTFVLLPQADASLSNDISFRRLPAFKSLWLRLLLSHPVALWHCLRIKADIVHIHDPELMPLAFVLTWLTGVRIVYDIHENVRKQLSFKFSNNSLILKWFYAYFDRLARRYFYLILAEFSYQDEYTDTRYKPLVIFNYPSLSFFEQFIRHDRTPALELFYVGQLSLARGIDTLIQALALLKKQGIQLNVNLFGGFEFDLHKVEELRQIEGFNEVNDLLKFYGKTDPRQVFKHAHKAIAGIALLKPVGDFPESYPTKIFEYMALELPVITSDFLLYRPVVEAHQCGFCIDPTNAQQLADTLRWLIEHPEKAQQMGKNGRKAAEQDYNWQSEEEKLLNFYNQILAT